MQMYNCIRIVLQEILKLCKHELNHASFYVSIVYNLSIFLYEKSVHRPTILDFTKGKSTTKLLKISFTREDMRDKLQYSNIMNILMS